MADWLKLNHPLLRSPKVRRLARALHCSKLEAFGLMVSWLVLVDEQTTDGCTGASVEDIDDELGRGGAVDGLIAIGWAELDSDGNVCAVDFGKHCGDTAKKRAMDARRKSLQRERDRWQKRDAPVTEESQHSVTEKRDAPVTEERDQKRKEKNRIINSSSDEFITPPIARERAHELPTNENEVLHFMANQAICGIRGETLETCAASFFDEMDACGWVNGKGVPVTNWQSQARSYLRKWQTQGGRGMRSNRPTITRRSDKKIDYTETPDL